MIPETHLYDKWVYVGNNPKLIKGKTYNIFIYNWADGRSATKYIYSDEIYIIDSKLDCVWSSDFKTLGEVRQEKLNDILTKE